MRKVISKSSWVGMLNHFLGISLVENHTWNMASSDEQDHERELLGQRSSAEEQQGLGFVGQQERWLVEQQAGDWQQTPWSHLSRTSELASCEARMLTMKSPQHLLRGVNAARSREPSTRARGDTRHTAMPSTSFQQTASLNMASIAVARHLTNARNRPPHNHKQIKKSSRGMPLPFTQSRFHSCQESQALCAA